MEVKCHRSLMFWWYQISKPPPGKFLWRSWGDSLLQVYHLHLNIGSMERLKWFFLRFLTTEDEVECRCRILLHECSVSKLPLWKWIIFFTQAHWHPWGGTDYRAKLKGTVTLLYVKAVNGLCHQVAIFTDCATRKMFPVLFCTFVTWHLQSMWKSGGNSSLSSLLAKAEPRFCSLPLVCTFWKRVRNHGGTQKIIKFINLQNII